MQVVPALAIHDTMKHIGSDVATVGFGACLGMTGFLMAVGKKVSPRQLRTVLACKVMAGRCVIHAFAIRRDLLVMTVTVMAL